MHKYICRAGHKGSKAEDLKKAIHYLENELNFTLRQSELMDMAEEFRSLLLNQTQHPTEIFDR